MVVDDPFEVTHIEYQEAEDLVVSLLQQGASVLAFSPVI
jgi:hypothetical protein